MSPVRRRLVVGGARLRLHLDLELLLSDLALAFEGDAVEDLLAPTLSDTTIRPSTTLALTGIDAGRLEVVNAALDRSRIRSGEIGLEACRVDARAAFDHDLLRKSRARTKEVHRRRSPTLEPERRETANPTHVAHSPSSRRGDNGHPRRSSSALTLRPRFYPPRFSCDARRTTLFPFPARGTGSFNGLLPFSATPANLYSATLHHFGEGVAARTRKDGRPFVN